MSMLEIWEHRMISFTNLFIMDENAAQMNYGVCFLTGTFSVYSTSHSSTMYYLRRIAFITFICAW